MKEQPNHQIYIRVLRDMGSEKRLRKAFELSEFSRSLFRQGLENRYPELPPGALAALYLERMEKARTRAD